MHYHSPASERLLSILIQGRNDNYMGNFTWRLSQALNRHAENIVVLGLEAEVEILVSDWGSEEPLHQVLELTENARRLVKFLIVPPDLARHYDLDAGYSNVHPINSVARRASGRFVMFSDSDVFIPLASMAKLVFHLRRGQVDNLPLDTHFFWASKYHVPTEIVRQNLSFDEICRVVDERWKEFHYDPVDKVNFRGGGVCLLVKREVWFAATGWDERLIYWGWFDIDLHRRLKAQMRWDLLELHDVRIFHFEHYSNRSDEQSQQKECKLKVNPQLDPTSFAPNGPAWGLANHQLTFLNGWGAPAMEQRSGVNEGRCEIHQLEDCSDIPILAQIQPVRIFQSLLQELKPQRWCVVSSDVSSLRIWDLVEHCGPVELTVVDQWNRESLSPSLRREIPGRLQDRLLDLFYLYAQRRNVANRTRWCRASVERAFIELRDAGKNFDLIWFVDELENEGMRTDVLKWVDLLTANGAMVGSCTPLYTAVYKVQAVDEMALAGRGLARLDLPEFWSFYPRRLSQSIERVVDAEYRTNEKVAALIEKIDRCYRQHYLDRGMPIPQL